MHYLSKRRNEADPLRQHRTALNQLPDSHGTDAAASSDIPPLPPSDLQGYSQQKTIAQPSKDAGLPAPHQSRAMQPSDGLWLADRHLLWAAQATR